MSEPCHAIVFRDVRERLCLRTASAAVCRDLLAFQETKDQDFLLSALLRAGEIECALGDKTGLCAAVITYVISRGIVQPEKANHYATIAYRCLEKSPYKGNLKVSRPEGFAFYGVHPLDYVDALEKIEFGPSGPILVIGVRSIGTTLSEAVVSKLQLKFGESRRVQAFSVRPCGHPYDRHCVFTESQIGIIRQDTKNTRVLVVDEGPGMSGSSFLSVAETLVGLGIEPAKITFLCSREVNPAELVAPNGAERWQRFHTHVVERNHFKPEEDAICVPAGEWRNAIAETECPGLWTTMRPAVFRSSEGEHVFEYHGLGHYGEDVRERINVLAAAGFTLYTEKAANGFSRTNPVPGKRLNKRELSSRVLDRMAEYLAFRASAFPVADTDQRASEFDNMARFNFREATGRELPAEFCFPVRSAVISDSQMMPYQWLQPDDGSPLVKLDAAADGDNHFFPGPVDTTWDIAGAIIEWEMDEPSREYLIARYAQLSSHDVRPILPAYIVAYAAFRNGYCRMAASAMAHDPREQARLLRDAQRYRSVMEVNCPESLAAAARVSSE